MQNKPRSPSISRSGQVDHQDPSAGRRVGGESSAGSDMGSARAMDHHQRLQTLPFVLPPLRDDSPSAAIHRRQVEPRLSPCHSPKFERISEGTPTIPIPTGEFSAIQFQRSTSHSSGNRLCDDGADFRPATPIHAPPGMARQRTFDDSHANHDRHRKSYHMPNRLALVPHPL